MLPVHRRAFFAVVRNCCVAGERPVAGVGIAKGERMAAGTVLVKIVDAKPLHQAVHKIAVRFVVLRTKLQWRIVADHSRDVVVGKPEVFKDLMKNVDRRLILKNAAIRTQLQAGDPGHDFCSVECGIARIARLANATSQAAVVPLAAAGQRDRNRHRFAEQLRKIDVGVVALEFEHALKWLPKRFGVVKRSQRERIAAQTTVDGHAFDETRLTGLRSCHTIATRDPIAVKEFLGISPQLFSYQLKV